MVNAEYRTENPKGGADKTWLDLEPYYGKISFARDENTATPDPHWFLRIETSNTTAFASFTNDDMLELFNAWVQFMDENDQQLKTKRG